MSIKLKDTIYDLINNSDKLDGVHLMGKGGTSGVIRSWARGTYTTTKQYFGNGNVVVLDPKPTDDSSLWANTTIFSVGDMEIRSHQLAFGYGEDKILYRRVSDGPIYNAWKTIAFTDSNVASATKLATARTITLTGAVTGSGSFDGSANLSITTTVKKRELGTNQGQGAELSYDDFDSENLAVKYAYITTSNLNTQLSYQKNSDKWTPYTEEINTVGFKSADKCLVIALFNKKTDSAPLDYAVVDIVSDGRKGDPGQTGPQGPKGDDSITLQSKNGNSHIFYLNTAGKALQSN
jgi:hypothetical protein